MAYDAKKMRQRWLYLPWAIAAVVFTGYFFMWRAGATEMKRAVASWVEGQRAAGMTISHGAIKAAGFPFFLRVHIEDPDIAYTDKWRWRTERLTIDALPYDLNRLIFSVPGEQKLHAGDYGDWRVTADDFRASIANDKTRDWVFAVTIGGATAHQTDGANTAELASLVFDLAPDPADSFTLVLSLAAADAEIGAQDHHLRLDRLQTVVATTEVHALRDPKSWRSAGGVLKINGFTASIDGARLSVAGEITLGHDDLPEGSLRTEIVAPDAFMRALASAGAISDDEAETAAAALTLAAIAGGGVLSAPIELKDGAAQIAGVTIADWSQGD